MESIGQRNTLVEFIWRCLESQSSFLAVDLVFFQLSSVFVASVTQLWGKLLDMPRKGIYNSLSFFAIDFCMHDKPRSDCLSTNAAIWVLLEPAIRSPTLWPVTTPPSTSGGSSLLDTASILRPRGSLFMFWCLAGIKPRSPFLIRFKKVLSGLSSCQNFVCVVQSVEESAAMPGSSLEL